MTGSKGGFVLPRGVPARIFLMLCGAATFVCGAMGVPPRISFPANPRFTVERLEDQLGMGAVTATCMGQDAQGFLWIGTQTGLYRYDGARARKMIEVQSITAHSLVVMLTTTNGTPCCPGNLC